MIRCPDKISSWSSQWRHDHRLIQPRKQDRKLILPMKARLVIEPANKGKIDDWFSQ